MVETNPRYASRVKDNGDMVNGLYKDRTKRKPNLVLSVMVLVNLVLLVLVLAVPL